VSPVVKLAKKADTLISVCDVHRARQGGTFAPTTSCPGSRRSRDNMSGASSGRDRNDALPTLGWHVKARQLRREDEGIIINGKRKGKFFCFRFLICFQLV
jgi:hypothetical protein